MHNDKFKSNIVRIKTKDYQVIIPEWEIPRTAKQ